MKTSSENHPIVLLGSLRDAHVAAVAETLRADGCEPVVFDASAYPDPSTVSLGTRHDEIEVDGRSLARPAAVYLRSLYQDPVGFGVDAEAEMQADWRRTMMAFRERGTVLAGLVQRWEALGVPIYNPPAARSNVTKPYQLARLAAAGLPIPSTLWSNDPARVRAFCSKRPSIYKPVAGGARTRRVEPDDLTDARLEALARAPVCFQELLPGDDIRVYVIDDRVVCALRIVADAIDFRQHEQAIEPIALSNEQARQCREACRVLGLRWTGMDLKADSSGALRILELNPSPMFLGFDARAGSGIRRALCDALLAHRERAWSS